MNTEARVHGVSQKVPRFAGPSELFDARTGFQELFKAKTASRVNYSKVTRADSATSSPKNSLIKDEQNGTASEKENLASKKDTAGTVKKSSSKAEKISSQASKEPESPASPLSPQSLPSPENPSSTGAASKHSSHNSPRNNPIENSKRSKDEAMNEAGRSSTFPSSIQVRPKVEAAIERLDENDQVIVRKHFGLPQKRGLGDLGCDTLTALLQSAGFDSCSVDEETSDHLADILRLLRKGPLTN